MNLHLERIASSIALIVSMTLCSFAAQQKAYTINTDKRYQQHEGWGVSLCWWANMCGRQSEEHLDSLINWLVSPEGLNYNIFRYNIGGGDEPTWRYCSTHHMGRGKGLRAEMEGFLDERGGEYNWNRDEAQVRIMRMIKQRRPDAVFEAFSNSAPWWMTWSGCVGGNLNANDDNLKPDYYEDFARYLVDVCKHMHDTYGIEFHTLAPFNEPVTPYWYCCGSQEGCHFSTKAQIDFVKILHPILTESGLNTVISVADETSVAQSIIDLQEYHDAGIMPLIGQFNTHTYQGNDKEKAELQRLAKDYGITLWQSETGDGGKGIEGNLRLAKRLIEDLRCLKPAAWLDWQFVEEFGDQWCTVNAQNDWKKYTRNRNYYIRQHFTKFIKTGFTFIEATDPNAVAAISADGQKVIYVTINLDASKQEKSLTIPKGFSPEEHFVTTDNKWMQQKEIATCTGEMMNIVMPPYSIATIVLNKK